MNGKNHTNNDILYHYIMGAKYASRMNNNIGKISRGKSYSYNQRRKRVLRSFFHFCLKENYFIKTGTNVALYYSVWQEHYIAAKSSRKSPLTLTSDITALWGALTKLCSPSVGGLPVIKLIPRPRKINHRVFTNIENDQFRLLGNLALPSEIGQNRLTLSLETDPDTFIKNLVDTMVKNRDVIYEVSKQYLDDAIDRFTFGCKARRKVSIKKFLDNPTLLHPHHKARGSGQHLSLFSEYLAGEDECGYTNLISYISHCHNGLITRDFIGGNNSLYRFTDTQYELREHFGISTLSAVAACNIIIIESGINVDSLRKLRLTSLGSMSNFFEVLTRGFRIRYHKARAKRIIRRHLKHAVDIPYIEIAFSYLVEATSHHRTFLSGSDAKRLFIFDSAAKSGRVVPMSDFPFKNGFKVLLKQAAIYLEQNPNWCNGVTSIDIDDVLQHSPNAKKLRATEGVIRWFQSGGNPAVAANYLGNTEAVAIKNYLPEELQLAVYNHKVRRFQNVLIAAATNGEEYQSSALNLQNERELQEYLSRLDKRIPNWKIAINQIVDRERISVTNRNRKKISLDICPENIAVLKACSEIEIKRISKGKNVNDRIKELSVVYQALRSYLETNSTRKHQRIVQEGERLYNRNDFMNTTITRIEVENGIN
ncbi:hypothetical protein [Vibrio parahaemolyticus]|uniref:hypothetical protein n=1 Tax=Vibrio parahaemolyticus TaxID=670 RepID=UPI00084A3063|nr:hypothetical protein [Vibrio parahaemolyticus]ODZ29849.1 hypothetical protein BBM38_22745 [Vibrio parahaemolyticus]ODZ35074.1 hypothetical protein BBM37_11655 [Vibrio parahaemolyticus]OHX56386.1 hypothetical protein BBZ60_12460 [Vibrio parahaemolyticus]